MAKVFISYRRTDSAPSAGCIYDRLVERFGRENVFKDVDDIPAEVSFGTYIQESLRQCAVLLVIIGRKWLDTEAVDGGRRLDDPTDWVRIEVETAFSLSLTVISLLVDGARVPKTAELPDALQELAQIHSLEVRNDPDFGRDMDRVIAALDRAFVPVSGPVAASAAPASAAAQDAVQEKPPVQAQQGPAGLRRFWRPLAAILAIVLVVGVFGVLLSKGFLGRGGGGNTAPIATEYPLSSGSHPEGITSGPDGALWFTESAADKIGRITTGGVVTEYPTLTSNSVPTRITSGPDSALWFTEFGVDKIGRITTAGIVTEYPVPSSGSGPWGITSGPDSALWFTEPGVGKIGRITTAGIVTEYPIPSSGNPHRITSGPDGTLWFTEFGTSKIGRITTAGVVTEYPTLSFGSFPEAITSGPDGALWFTEYGANKIGQITTGGVVTEYPIPSSGSDPSGITSGPDGALWFTEKGRGKIGRIATGGVVTEYPTSSPGSQPEGITSGPDGALWFTEEVVGKIGRIVP